MGEKDINEYFTEKELGQPMLLLPRFGPNLIYDHSLNTENFKGNICGCAIIFKDQLLDKVLVGSSFTRNHDNVIRYHDNLCEVINEERSKKTRIKPIDLYSVYGFVTDSGYFLTRYQACQVGMKNGQVRSKHPGAIRSHHVVQWASCPYNSVEFQLKNYTL